ncbi:MAG: pitrilysin family protein, partial [Fimbriimonadales bacterium]
MMKWLGGLAILLLFGWGVAQARPERTQLPNGLQLITERVPQMPLVAMEVWVRAGVADETPETSGVAHLLEHLLFKGAPNHPKGALDLAFERAGGLLEASTERDWVRFRATVLKDRWQTPLEILLAHLFHPLLPEAELERERTIILEDEYPLHRLSPVRVARYALFAQRFPNHAYGLPLLGDPDRLRTLPIAPVRAFHRQHYQPDRFVVVLVGDLSHEEALRIVKASSPSRSLSASPATGVSAESPVPTLWSALSSPCEVLAVSLPAPPAQQVDALLMTELLRVALAEPYLGLLYARFSETESRLPFGRLHSEFLPRAQPGLVAFYFLPPVPAVEDWQTRVRQ